MHDCVRNYDEEFVNKRVDKEPSLSPILDAREAVELVQVQNYSRNDQIIERKETFNWRIFYFSLIRRVVRSTVSET